jgi:hypothetical protein
VQRVLRASSAVLCGLTLLSAGCTGPYAGSDLNVRYRISGVAGLRSLYDEPGGEVIDSQGLELAVHSENNDAAAVLSVGQTSLRLEQSGAPSVPIDLTEAMFGGRCTFWHITDSLHMYGGGGLAFEIAETDAFGGDKSERGQAAYVELGIELWTGRHLEVGVNLRSLWSSTLDVGSVEVDPDYLEAALRLGWVF